MEETFKAITLWLASGTEAAAALIIGLASIEGTVRALILFVPGTGQKLPTVLNVEEVGRLSGDRRCAP